MFATITLCLVQLAISACRALVTILLIRFVVTWGDFFIHSVPRHVDWIRDQTVAMKNLTLEVTCGLNAAGMEGTQSAALGRHVDRKVRAHPSYA